MIFAVVEKGEIEMVENIGVNIKYNVFDRFKSMNIDELAEWLDKYGMFENSPWMLWFDLFKRISAHG